MKVKDKNIDEGGTAEVFAEPTYDLTFKMLFGNEQNKDILISFLNNILGFQGDKEIKEVDINSNALLGDSSKSVQGSVDVVCTTKNNQKIAIEMQREFKDYFLSREQEYMAKIISQQVSVGQSEKYHEAMMDTYIVVMAKNNIFPDRKLKDEKQQNKFQEVYDLDKKNASNEIYYHKEIIPMIKGYNIEVPDNKKHWVFCELTKFKKQYKNKEVTSIDSLKVQWLDFLINASERESIPSNLDNIIKKGYEIMKMSLWEQDQQIVYWRQKRDQDLSEQSLKQKIDGAFKEGEEKGIQKGKWKGEIKGEIGKIKMGIKYNMKSEQIKNELKFLTNDENTNNFDINFKYIEEHLSDNESVIMGAMDIEYADDFN